jgi:phenylpropionate dioxygenase-like ring-hydroxylating dioxygenase large terminal subunit
MVATNDAEQTVSAGEKLARDNRNVLPRLGFTEYWYPALPETMVRKKPCTWKMLGKDLVFFQGKEKGTVAAIDPMCVHRNASLTEGECHWRGTITCPYHGWTYNEQGEVVACLNEGPNSTIPETKPKSRIYPTQVHKGMVFVWMGEGEPAPIEEDVPPELFREDTPVKFHIDHWFGDWRASAENGQEGHAPYLHRNSFRMTLFSHRFVGPGVGERYKIINGRTIRRVPLKETSAMPATAKQEFPVLGHGWPKSQWRKLWSWIFEGFLTRNRTRPVFPDGVQGLGEEWEGISQHLPGQVRRVDSEGAYTRAIVPMTEQVSRQVYYHWSPYAQNPITRFFDRLHWTVYGTWKRNINFSQQDNRANAFLKYGNKEYLSPHDSCVIAWRKLCTMARGVPPHEVEKSEQELAETSAG